MINQFTIFFLLCANGCTHYMHVALQHWWMRMRMRRSNECKMIWCLRWFPLFVKISVKFPPNRNIEFLIHIYFLPHGLWTSLMAVLLQPIDCDASSVVIGEYNNDDENIVKSLQLHYFSFIFHLLLFFFIVFSTTVKNEKENLLNECECMYV